MPHSSNKRRRPLGVLIFVDLLDSLKLQFSPVQMHHFNPDQFALLTEVCGSNFELT